MAAFFRQPQWMETWVTELYRSMRDKAWNEQGIVDRDVSDLPGDFWKEPAWADVVGLKIKMREDIPIVVTGGRLGTCTVGPGEEVATIAPVVRGWGLWEPGEAAVWIGERSLEQQGGLPREVWTELFEVAWGPVGTTCGHAGESPSPSPSRWFAPLSVGMGFDRGVLAEIPCELQSEVVVNEGNDPLKHLLAFGCCGHCGTRIAEQGELDYRKKIKEQTFVTGLNGEIELDGQYPELGYWELDIVNEVMACDPNTQWEVGLWNVKGHCREMLVIANEKCWIVKSKYVAFVVTKAKHLNTLLLGELPVFERFSIVFRSEFGSESCVVQTIKNIGGFSSVIEMKYEDYRAYLRNRIYSHLLNSPTQAQP